MTVAPAGDNDPQSLDRLRDQIKSRRREGAVEQLQIGGNEVVLVDSSGDDGDAGDDAGRRRRKAAIER